MNNQFYIASCVFTEEYPELSQKIQNYVKTRFNFPIMRCCVAIFEERTEKVIAYCHYCVRGSNLGGKIGIHLTQILFE